MSFPPLHRFKVLRPRAVLEACARFFQRVIKLLEIPAPEAEQWIRRITVMEREIMLPIKLVGILMIYSFYFTRWTGYAHTALEINVEAVEYFFWVYVGVNIVFAALLLGMRRLPLALMQWVVFVMILGDGLFLSALTLVTGGYQSILYWLFLGLIVRSAVSVPRATSQILLNATIILCYVLAGVIEISIARNLAEHTRANNAMQRMVRQAAELGVPAGRTGSGASRARVHTNLDNALPATNRPRTLAPLVEDRDEPAEPENAADPLVVRLVLLILLTICAYGVRVLLERQREAEEEAREFGLREGQLRSAGRLAAEFAHQIKNPLAIINNAAYSLQRALKERKSEVAEQLRIIQEEVEHSDRIITELMGYAHLTEGRVEKLNAIEELNHAIERVFPPAACFPVQIHREYAQSFPPLLMQRRHLSETFINVLQNAREALNGKNGSIRVRAHCRSDYAIEVAISDNGPGIPVDKLEKIFEAYYTTKEKGTGLGLATVKHNVELYGGTVRVESALGQGARFVLVFPAKTSIRLAKTN
jgi:signal transduction histidine kinase